MATRSGSAMGTPAFMSPEQARGLWDQVDGRSDVWSVGATMWQSLTGKLVHEGRTANEELLSAMTNPAPPILSVLPKLSPAVAQVFDRALAFDKEKRWLDAARMQEGVRRAYHDRHSAPITTAPKLTVPETVPNRTISPPADVPSPRPATTGRPVANSLSALRSLASSRRPVAVAAVGVVAAGLVVSGITWVVSASHGTASAGASSASMPSPMQPTALPASAEPGRATATTEPVPTASSPPAIAATDLPTVATSAAPPPPRPLPATRATPAPAPSPQPPATPAKPDCSPPYTVDSAGHRHWKAQCL
ncbi:MAG: serine/threonine protein kinase [Polyangiaceae bacterium]